MKKAPSSSFKSARAAPGCASIVGSTGTGSNLVRIVSAKTGWRRVRWERLSLLRWRDIRHGGTEASDFARELETSPDPGGTRAGGETNRSSQRWRRRQTARRPVLLAAGTRPAAPLLGAQRPPVSHRRPGDSRQRARRALFRWPSSSTTARQFDQQGSHLFATLLILGSGEQKFRFRSWVKIWCRRSCIPNKIPCAGKTGVITLPAAVESGAPASTIYRAVEGYRSDSDRLCSEPSVFIYLAPHGVRSSTSSPRAITGVYRQQPEV